MAEQTKFFHANGVFVFFFLNGFFSCFIYFLSAPLPPSFWGDLGTLNVQPLNHCPQGFLFIQGLVPGFGLVQTLEWVQIPKDFTFGNLEPDSRSL